MSLRASMFEEAFGVDLAVAPVTSVSVSRARSCRRVVGASPQSQGTLVCSARSCCGGVCRRRVGVQRAFHVAVACVTAAWMCSALRVAVACVAVALVLAHVRVAMACRGRRMARRCAARAGVPRPFGSSHDGVSRGLRRARPRRLPVRQEQNAQYVFASSTQYRSHESVQQKSST